MSTGKDVPGDLMYTKEHEWIRRDGNKGRIGITDHAQHALGDIVFLELPQVGRRVKAGEAVGVVESVKAVSDIYSPATGVVTSSNASVNPALVNSDSYGAGWLFEIEIEIESTGELISPESYSAHIG